jgi:hypothetical protein
MTISTIILILIAALVIAAISGPFVEYIIPLELLIIIAMLGCASIQKAIYKTPENIAWVIVELTNQTSIGGQLPQKSEHNINMLSINNTLSINIPTNETEFVEQTINTTTILKIRYTTEENARLAAQNYWNQQAPETLIQFENQTDNNNNQNNQKIPTFHSPKEPANSPNENTQNWQKSAKSRKTETSTYELITQIQKENEELERKIKEQTIKKAEQTEIELAYKLLTQLQKKNEELEKKIEELTAQNY